MGNIEIIPRTEQGLAHTIDGSWRDGAQARKPRRGDGRDADESADGKKVQVGNGIGTCKSC